MTKTQNKETEPVLYIIVRTNLGSFNPGKKMAQAAHAANLFAKEAEIQAGYINSLYKKWSTQTDQHFGTTIVLTHEGQTWYEVLKAVDNAIQLDRCLANIVVDPTYPINDGEITHLIELETCAYVFCDSNDKASKFLLSTFELHP